MSLKVTTWNILAPVWANPNLYAKIARPALDPPSRRKTIAERLKKFNSDLVALEEVQEEELTLIRKDTPWIDQTYHVHFFGNDDVLWSDWGTWTDWKPNGLAVLVKKSKFVGKGATSTFLTDPDDGKPIRKTGAGNCAALVTVKLLNGQNLLFVANHLDAESPSLGSRQCKMLTKHLNKLLLDETPIVWCGDFNLELNSVGLTYVRKHSEFKNACSDFHHQDGTVGRASSVYGMGGSARLDHVYVSPGVECSDPEVPRTTLSYILGTMFVHNTALSIGEASKWKQALLGLLLLILLPFTIVLVIVLVISLRQAAVRSKWSLEVWGSDHLPVTVQVALPKRTLPDTKFVALSQVSEV